MAAEIFRSRRDLGENLDEILRSRRDLGKNLGEFLAAEILRSRRDLGRESRRDFEISARISAGFGRRDFKISPRSRRDLTEISPRSRQSRRPKTRRDSRRDLGQNFAGEVPCLKQNSKFFDLKETNSSNVSPRR